MKTHSLFRALAAAALAVGGLVLSVSAAKPASAPVEVRIDFDRPVLPADEVQRAIVKIGLRGC
ncbi:MAG TPA: hypothetical protein VK163_11630, partial [Opitutaceae bacterium]|nr:hypothetical protein [Opitutaceae bacterium]